MWAHGIGMGWDGMIRDKRFRLETQSLCLALHPLSPLLASFERGGAVACLHRNACGGPASGSSRAAQMANAWMLGPAGAYRVQAESEMLREWGLGEE